MGIHGLLQFLKPCIRKVSIEEFKGKTIGVDAMCWMHKGAFACARELVLEEDTDAFVHFFVKMCQVLLSSSIKPVIVFDGARLPAKAKEEANRTEHREQCRDEALKLFQKRERGDIVDDQQIDGKCRGAIKITGAMIARLMTALDELKISFCVAPYEADAQLAYMCRRGWVHAVISEDSDLLAYGCPNTIFKMDKFGNGDSIALPFLQADASPPPALPDCDSEQADDGADVAAADDAEARANGQEEDKSSGRGKQRPGRGRGRGRGRGKVPDLLEDDGDGGENGAEGSSKAPSFKGWTAEKFTEFCVLCGTDYKEYDIKIKLFGIKKAHALLRRFNSSKRMFKWMRSQKLWQDRFPCDKDEYLQRFSNVLAVFFHHIAFDPNIGECVSVAQAFPNCDRIISGANVEELCGKGPPNESAMLVWRGKLDSRTLKPRLQEPLTPAERRLLDSIMRKTNEEQRAVLLERKLKADAAEIAAAREAKQVAQASVANIAATVQRTVQEGGANHASDPIREDMEDDGPKEVSLLPGDGLAIAAMLGAVQQSRQDHDRGNDSSQGGSVEKAASAAFEPPRNPFVRQALGSRPVAPANPFARRRSQSATEADSLSRETCACGYELEEDSQFCRKCGTKRAEAAVGGSLPAAGQELDRAAKRQRCLGSRLDGRLLAQQDLTTRSIVRPVATPSNKPAARQVAATILGPRGGNSALDAAKTVLAQQGMPELEAMEPSKDRSRLTAFFRHHQEKKEVAPPPKKRALESWKARPWEEDTQDEDQTDTSKLLVNPLSNRAGGNLFARGWK